MKRYGSTTISRDLLVELLHSHVAADAAACIADDIHDGTILSTAYMGSVEQLHFLVTMEDEIEVEWAAIVHNA
jgi:hypothetical protein